MKRDKDSEATSMNSRIYTILKALSLESQLVDTEVMNMLDCREDLYENIDELFEPLREKSLDFLKTVFETSNT